MNISNNIASITTHQSMLNTSAHNVANINTDGFVPSNADNNGSPRSQTDLTKEIPEQMVAEDGVAVNVSVIKTQDEMLGSLLDMKA